MLTAFDAVTIESHHPRLRKQSLHRFFNALCAFANVIHVTTVTLRAMIEGGFYRTTMVATQHTASPM
tara:strand:- start:105 stop:305 length:201 start_codon:yes stop_codon:yes gene_type:complete